MSPCDIRIVESFDDRFIRALSSFAMERFDPGRWRGRWEPSFAFMKWKLTENPVRRGMVACAFEAERIVGTVCVSFKHLRFRDRVLLAAEFEDLAVTQGMRKKGIFTTLVGAAIQACEGAGAELAYSIPNAVGFAALVHTGRFTSTPHANHFTWALPVRPLRLASALGERAELSKSPEPLDEAPAFEFSGDVPELAWVPTEETRVVLDAPYLRYRLAQHPDARRYFLVQVEGGAAVFKRVAFCGASALLLMRASYKENRAFNKVIAAGEAAHQHGATFVALWAPKRPHLTAKLLSHGWLPVQNKRVAVATAFRSRHPSEAVDHLHLEFLDSDKA